MGAKAQLTQRSTSVTPVAGCSLAEVGKEHHARTPTQTEKEKTVVEKLTQQVCSLLLNQRCRAYLHAS
eukprot:s1502_g4.t1